MDIIRLVEDLEDIIETSNTIPLTGKVMLEKEEVLEILAQLRAEIPSEVSEATQIKTDREMIIEEAHRQANQIISSAKSQADKILDEDELVVKANSKAKEILEIAQLESDKIREGTINYADELLEDTQVKLSDIIKMLNENRKELRG